MIISPSPGAQLTNSGSFDPMLIPVIDFQVTGFDFSSDAGTTPNLLGPPACQVIHRGQRLIGAGNRCLDPDPMENVCHSITSNPTYHNSIVALSQ
jgi:hypothetical protein